MPEGPWEHTDNRLAHVFFTTEGSECLIKSLGPQYREGNGLINAMHRDSEGKQYFKEITEEEWGSWERRLENFPNWRVERYDERKNFGIVIRFPPEDLGELTRIVESL